MALTFTGAVDVIPLSLRWCVAPPSWGKRPAVSLLPGCSRAHGRRLLSNTNTFQHHITHSNIFAMFTGVFSLNNMTVNVSNLSLKPTVQGMDKLTGRYCCVIVLGLHYIATPLLLNYKMFVINRLDYKMLCHFLGLQEVKSCKNWTDSFLRDTYEWFKKISIFPYFILFSLRYEILVFLLFRNIFVNETTNGAEPVSLYGHFRVFDYPNDEISSWTGDITSQRYNKFVQLREFVTLVRANLTEKNRIRMWKCFCRPNLF